MGKIIIALSLFFIILTVCIVMFIRFALLVATVVSQSMSPTLEVGDRVLALRHWPARWLHKGQIVLLRFPEGYSWPNVNTSDPIPLIKRVAGLEGDVVVGLLDDTDVTPTLKLVNVQTSNEPRDIHSWLIPMGHFFVRGDNYLASIDSTQWGAIPFSCLLAVVVLRLPGRKDPFPQLEQLSDMFPAQSEEDQ